jgi:peptidoglycan hydrolase CwlO-like protein
MHRLLVVLLAVLPAVLSLAQPAFADDITNREDVVKQRLADASASTTRLDGQIAALETSIAETQQRSDREREQLRILARVLYAQPAGDDMLMTVLSANSLSDALTRMGDLASAAHQASRTRWALDRDLASLSAQKAQLVSDRQHQVKVQAQLQEEFDRLVELEAQRLEAQRLEAQRVEAQRVEAQRLAALHAPPAAPAAAPAATPAPPAAPAPTPAHTPAPAPPPPPPPAPAPAAGSIQQIILNAFAPLGPGAQQWALRVAKCESGYNPNAVNRSSGASGLFQFMPATWASLPQHNQSVFDPVANAQAAAVLYQRSGPNQWSCK